MRIAIGAVLLCLMPALVPAATLRVATTPDVVADYRTLVGERPPGSITQYQGPGARRDTVEMLLVQQALTLGGDTRRVEFVTAPTYRRMLALVADGHADLTGTSVWGADIDADADRLQASSALIADGDFRAAIFVLASRDDLPARIRAGRWQGLTAVSSHAWTPDWLALQRLGLDHVYDVAEWPSMVRMVGAGRADFLLAPFQPEASPGIELEGTRLVAVSGVCVALAGSRHLALPRGPAGDRLRQTLERGLTELRRRRAVARAYAAAGSQGPADCRKP